MSVAEMDPVRAIPLCTAAHGRLMATVAGITDDIVRRPTRLPGWTVAHVMTHLARNADGHAQRLQGALAGVEVPRYVGGMEQRNRDSERGAPSDLQLEPWL